MSWQCWFEVPLGPGSRRWCFRSLTWEESAAVPGKRGGHRLLRSLLAPAPLAGTARPGRECKQSVKCLSPALSFALFVGESGWEWEVCWCCAARGGSCKISIKRQSPSWASGRFCLGSRALGLAFSREKTPTEILPCWGGWEKETSLFASFWSNFLVVLSYNVLRMQRAGSDSWCSPARLGAGAWLRWVCTVVYPSSACAGSAPWCIHPLPALGLHRGVSILCLRWVCTMVYPSSACPGPGGLAAPALGVACQRGLSERPSRFECPGRKIKTTALTKEIVVLGCI